MKDGTGEGYTEAVHPALANQLYAAYARSAQVRILASVVGEEGLSATDQAYLAFGDAFESTVVNHGAPRSLAESMAAGWQALRHLPHSELHRLSDEEIARHLAPLGAVAGEAAEGQTP